jgi:sulfatase-modifying factor enzyme 1
LAHGSNKFEIFRQSDGETSGRRSQSLRGGSWNNNDNNARVSIRNNNNPNNRNNNIGFRVVVFHSFASDFCVASSVLDYGQTSRQNWLTFCPVVYSYLLSHWERLGEGQPNT